MNVFWFKSKVWTSILLIFFIIYLLTGESLARETFRTGAEVSGTISQSLTPPASVTKVCSGVPIPGDDQCPREDKSEVTLSPGKAGVTVPAPGGKKFTFSGLCGLTGRGKNACIAVVDCLENNGNCAITDCLKKPSLEECKQLCSMDPTNFACAAFECADNPGRDCCGIVNIPECCDFFNILDDFNSCRKNPGAECCALITSFGGDTEFQDMCNNAVRCFQVTDSTCCTLFPKSSQLCVNILGCSGLTSTSSNAQMDSCCRVFPDNILCDIYDCKKRIDAGDGRGCCEMVDGVIGAGYCDAFYNCKTVLETGLLSPAAKTCCDSPLFGQDLQACQALECINMLSNIVRDDGVVASGGGSLEYCCSLTPNSETCQKLVKCYTDPATECCNLFTPYTSIPACALIPCYNGFIGDTSTTGAYPPPACCDVLSNVPKCQQILQCLNVPTTSCCSLLSTFNPALATMCANIASCVTTIIDPTATFAAKSTCCKLFPQETSAWCTNFFLCDANPDALCCAATSPFTDSPNCKGYLACLTDPTPSCCARYPNASDPTLLPVTLGCKIVLDCVKQPEYACCILPSLRKIPICANLIKCTTTGGVACCKLFPTVAADCASLLQCYEDLTESKNTNNACCSALSATQLASFQQCADILACATTIVDTSAVFEDRIACCKLIPGDTYRAVCDALFSSIVPNVVDCFTPGVFGGCGCPPNSPGGSNMNETIF